MFGIGRKNSFAAVCVTVSERGLVRKDNQDHLFVDGAKTLFCVADGMGGGSDGALASEIVCAEIAKVGAVGFTERMRAVDAAIAAANGRILDHVREKGLKQMGSTVAVLLLDPEDARRAAICHVGDSRIYRVRGGIAELLTHDHTIGGQLSELAKGKQSSDFRSRANPLAHVLTRAIGVGPEVAGDWRRLDLAEDDAFLVCSDGVHDVISDSQVGEFLSLSKSPEEAADVLSKQIVKCGAPDNYSFVLIRIGVKS